MLYILNIKSYLFWAIVKKCKGIKILIMIIKVENNLMIVMLYIVYFTDFVVMPGCVQEYFLAMCLECSPCRTQETIKVSGYLQVKFHLYYYLSNIEMLSVTTVYEPTGNAIFSQFSKTYHDINMSYW